MNNFIVPIDFSDASKNAARYAAHIANGVPDANLILYNVFDVLEYGSDSSPLSTEGDEDSSRKQIVELGLESVRRDISTITNAGISIVAEENNHFLDALEAYVLNNDVQFIVMGTTGSTRLGEMLMGGNTLNIVRRRIVPVIIVPPPAQNLVLPPKPKPPAPKPDASAQSPDTPNTPGSGQCHYEGKTRVCP